jgi:hypothetical protein
MSEPIPLSEAEEADLTALADGRLEPARRAEVEARVESDARLAHALDRQRAGLTAITAAAASVSAPVALRSRVEAMQREPAPRRRWRMPSLRILVPAAGLAVAAAVALFVVFAGGAPSTDTILAAATRPPTATVSLDPTQPALLRDRVEEVRFPNFEGKFGWEAKGTRTDELDGRDTRTVFYRREGREAAYTIVGGEALPWPDGERTTIDGVKLRSFIDGDRTVVTWRRGGRTCVLSGRGVSKASLLELAAWKGKGAVTF